MTIIQQRRDTAANWTAVNPVLAEGEPGLETDTNELKYGDGVSDWNTLSYFGPSTNEVITVEHGVAPAITAVGDKPDLIANRAGIPFMIGGHPNIISAEYITTTSQTDDNILPAISSGTIYVITFIAVIASADNTVNTSVRIGFGATGVPAQGSSGADAVSGVIISHPNIPPGSGVTKGNGGGIIGIGGDGFELRITNSAPTNGSLIVQCDFYTINS